MAKEEYFSGTYVEARSKFRQSAKEAGADITSYVNHTAPDPDAIALSTDVAVIGAKSAKRCLLLISGTHGVEGFGGSACQVGFFLDKLYELLSKDTCAVLVHALNPYGFAYLRRVNEDNVDLNRNCQDFAKELPPNVEYGILHSMLIPVDWDGEGRKTAEAELQQYIKTKGLDTLKDAASAGQYSHPTGLFFGGSKRTWSVLTFQKILREHVPSKIQRMVAIDLHTGLGPFGYGEPIFVGNDLRQFFRAQNAFGPELKSLEANNSASSVVTGTLISALQETMCIADMMFLALEFGTVPVVQVLTALRGDHWLHSGNNIQSNLKQEIKTKLRDAFYVDSPQWKAAVYGRAVDFVIRASRELAKP
jgi:Protein of unknown function (DUF2817)